MNLHKFLTFSVINIVAFSNCIASEYFKEKSIENFYKEKVNQYGKLNLLTIDKISTYDNILKKVDYAVTQEFGKDNNKEWVKKEYAKNEKNTTKNAIKDIISLVTQLKSNTGVFNNGKHIKDNEPLILDLLGFHTESLKKASFQNGFFMTRKLLDSISYNEDDKTFSFENSNNWEKWIQDLKTMGVELSAEEKISRKKDIDIYFKDLDISNIMINMLNMKKSNQENEWNIDSAWEVIKKPFDNEGQFDFGENKLDPSSIFNNNGNISEDILDPKYQIGGIDSLAYCLVRYKNSLSYNKNYSSLEERETQEQNLFNNKNVSKFINTIIDNKSVLTNAIELYKYLLNNLRLEETDLPLSNISYQIRARAQDILKMFLSQVCKKIKEKGLDYEEKGNVSYGEQRDFIIEILNQCFFTLENNQKIDNIVNSKVDNIKKNDDIEITNEYDEGIYGNQGDNNEENIKPLTIQAGNRDAVLNIFKEKYKKALEDYQCDKKEDYAISLDDKKFTFFLADESPRMRQAYLQALLETTAYFQQDKWERTGIENLNNNEHNKDVNLDTINTNQIIPNNDLNKLIDQYEKDNNDLLVERENERGKVVGNKTENVEKQGEEEYNNFQKDLEDEEAQRENLVLKNLNKLKNFQKEIDQATEQSNLLNYLLEDFSEMEFINTIYKNRPQSSLNRRDLNDFINKSQEYYPSNSELIVKQISSFYNKQFQNYWRNKNDIFEPFNIKYNTIQRIGQKILANTDSLVEDISKLTRNGSFDKNLKKLLINEYLSINIDSLVADISKLTRDGYFAKNLKSILTNRYQRVNVNSLVEDISKLENNNSFKENLENLLIDKYSSIINANLLVEDISKLENNNSFKENLENLVNIYDQFLLSDSILKHDEFFKENLEELIKNYPLLESVKVKEGEDEFFANDLLKKIYNLLYDDKNSITKSSEVLKYISLCHKYVSNYLTDNNQKNKNLLKMFNLLEKRIEELESTKIQTSLIQLNTLSNFDKLIQNKMRIKNELKLQVVNQYNMHKNNSIKTSFRINSKDLEERLFHDYYYQGGYLEFTNNYSRQISNLKNYLKVYNKEIRDPRYEPKFNYNGKIENDKKIISNALKPILPDYFKNNDFEISSDAAQRIIKHWNLGQE